MATTFYLTNEAADIAGYLRLKLGSRSASPSLVRTVVATAAGPSSGITLGSWITDPLDGTDLAASGNITFHLWAKESDAAANVALRAQLFVFTTSEAGSALVDDNDGSELTTTISEQVLSVSAASQSLNRGDRLVLRVLADDAGTMAADYSVTLSYNGLYARAEGDSYLSLPDSVTLSAVMPPTTRNRIRRILQDTDIDNPLLDDLDIDRAFEAALTIYNRDRPRTAIGTLSGDNTTTQFGLPRFWSSGLSYITGVEYPVGERPRRMLEPGDYEIYETVLGSQPYRTLLFPGITPETGTDNIAIWYTAGHVHTDETDTVPAEDLDALCCLAGAQGALMLAAEAAASSNPTINADSVDHRDSETRWQSVANALRERYLNHIGGGSEEGGPTSIPVSRMIDWDTNLSYGSDRVFHGRRYR